MLCRDRILVSFSRIGLIPFPIKEEEKSARSFATHHFLVYTHSYETRSIPKAGGCRSNWIRLRRGIRARCALSGQPRRQPAGARGGDQNAKRLGLSRRDFLVSACGAASALLAFNAANAAAGKRGGFFELEPEAALEPQLAQARLGGKGEFIFDVQGHFVDPTGAWVDSACRCFQVVAQGGLRARRQTRDAQSSQLPRTRGIRERRISR